MSLVAEEMKQEWELLSFHLLELFEISIKGRKQVCNIRSAVVRAKGQWSTHNLSASSRSQQ